MAYTNICCDWLGSKPYLYYVVKERKLIITKNQKAKFISNDVTIFKKTQEFSYPIIGMHGYK